MRVTAVGDGDHEPEIAVGFVERPESDHEFRVQRLGIENLGKGAYDLSISMQLPDGRTVTRSKGYGG